MNGKRYKLRVFPLFEEDLNRIIDYIALRLKNPLATERLVEDVEAAIQERLTCAEMFEPYPSAKERPHPYYRLRFRYFTVFYVVLGDSMEVRRILYSRRDIDLHLD